MTTLRRHLTHVLLIVGPLAFVILETAGGRVP